MAKIEYAVIDDFGNNWEHGNIAFGPFNTLETAEDIAEVENYHSASIVKIVDGKRVQLMY